MTPHKHLWFNEQQSGHKWCHWCGVHAPESRGKCIEKPRINVNVSMSATRVVTNAIGGPPTVPARGVR